jgi:signal transduction histidine kinase
MSKIVQLEGHDEHATVFGQNRSYSYQRYANLLPGTYHLAVSGGDEMGFIDENNRRRVTIVVFPYWYQRWWAYVLFASVAGSILTIFLTAHIRRLQKARRVQQEFTRKLIEVQEEGRKGLAAELHDELGQDLLVVSNELQQYLNDPAVTRDELRHVTGLMQESIEAVREISSNLHPHHIERLGFCAAVEAMVDKLSHSSPIKISCTCGPVDAILPKEARIHVFRIIQESLSNIIKHSGATEARLAVVRRGGQIEITIEDNGKGFDVSRSSSTVLDQARGFGIAGLTERARIIGAKLSIVSAPKQGTRIQVTIPITGE